MAENTVGSDNELQILQALEASPDTTQADLAAQVGVAVGTVNWYLKRWSKKGYVKVRRMGRWNWSYLLTAEGMAHKARLATEYVEASMSLYRQTRADARRLLGQVVEAGYDQVAIDGDGEIADICRLTCLELQVGRAEAGNGAGPRLQIDGAQLQLIWPEAKPHE